MNTKVANFIAAQFGILIGLMTWLVYMQFQSGERQTASLREGAVAPLEAAAPALEAEIQRPSAVTYQPDRQLVQPVVQRVLQPVQYYQETVAEPEPDNSTIPVNSASYSDVGQAPATLPSDYVAAPQPIYYAEPSQLVIIGDSRRRRHRSTNGLIDRPGQIARQFPDRGNQDIRIPTGPPPPSSVPLPPGGPPAPGFQPRSSAGAAVHPGGRPARAAFPGTPRTGRTGSAP